MHNSFSYFTHSTKSALTRELGGGGEETGSISKVSGLHLQTNIHPKYLFLRCQFEKLLNSVCKTKQIRVREMSKGRASVVLLFPDFPSVHPSPLRAPSVQQFRLLYKIYSIKDLPQHEPFLSPWSFVFAPFSLEFYLNYEVSIEIQGLPSNDYNFQGLLLNSSRKDSHVKGTRILVGELV